MSVTTHALTALEPAETINRLRHTAAPQNAFATAKNSRKIVTVASINAKLDYTFGLPW